MVNMVLTPSDLLLTIITLALLPLILLVNLHSSMDSWDSHFTSTAVSAPSNCLLLHPRTFIIFLHPFIDAYFTVTGQTILCGFIAVEKLSSSGGKSFAFRASLFQGAYCAYFYTISLFIMASICFCCFAGTCLTSAL